MPKVGTKLRELRRRRDLGVRDLAVRSGVSHSTISLIERNRISPSIDTMSAILEALGTTLTWFFSELPLKLPCSPFYIADNFIEIGRANKISYRMLGVNHPNRQLLMLHEIYAVGSDSGEAFSHSAEEAGIVIRGAVEVTVGDQSRILHKGEGYYFDSQIPHRFRNVADEESEIVSSVTPPTY